MQIRFTTAFSCAALLLASTAMADDAGAPKSVAAQSSSKQQVLPSNVEPSARAIAVKSFATAGYSALFTFDAHTDEQSLGDNSRYFTDVASYQTYRAFIKDDGVLDTIRSDDASVTETLVGDPVIAPANDDMSLWSATFLMKQTKVGHQPELDRCFAVDARIQADGHPPLGDSYAFTTLKVTDAASRDCHIGSSTPRAKAVAKIDQSTRKESLDGFLQSASASLFRIVPDTDDQKQRDNIRFFFDENAFNGYANAVGKSQIGDFLKLNQMVAQGQYAGGLTFDHDALVDTPWHTTFYVKQGLSNASMSLTRCLAVKADIFDLPPKFGGAEHVIDTISFAPATDETSCESGKELTAAVWSLVNQANGDGAQKTEPAR